MIKLDKGRMQQGAASITLNATGNLTTAVQVTFPQSFEVTPNILVSAPYGATQSKYSGSTVTTTSFYIAVATETISTYQSQTFPVEWVAVEPG
jgi:hypothetical protein